nr:period circadian protein-like [Solanum lycopersicum]
MGQPGGYPNRKPSSSQPPLSSQPSSSSQPPLFSQPSSSSQLPLFSQPSSSSQPPLFSRPSSSSQPPVFNHQGSSMCFDSSAVRREQKPAKSRGTCRGTGRGTDRGNGRGTGTGTGTASEIGRGSVFNIGGVSSQQPDQPRAVEASISTGRQKRTKTIGFGIYTNASGSQTFNVSVYIKVSF